MQEARSTVESVCESVIRDGLACVLVVLGPHEQVRADGLARGIAYELVQRLSARSEASFSFQAWIPADTRLGLPKLTTYAYRDRHIVLYADAPDVEYALHGVKGACAKLCKTLRAAAAAEAAATDAAAADAGAARTIVVCACSEQGVGARALRLLVEALRSEPRGGVVHAGYVKESVSRRGRACARSQEDPKKRTGVHIPVARALANYTVTLADIAAALLDARAQRDNVLDDVASRIALSIQSEAAAFLVASDR